MTDDDTTAEDPVANESKDHARSRRGLIAGAVIGGAAVAGGLAGAGAAAATSSGGGWKRSKLQFDVACLGDTWRDVTARNPADDGDFRVPFLVEGLLYPPGTVLDGFVPTTDGSLGHWFCQGWLLVDANRPEPHISSTQKYVLGVISEDRLFPPDLIASSGLEGTFDDGQPPTRIVIGGTGEYLGASGAVVQESRGVNTTVLADGSGANALNFTFTFDLLLPDV